MKLHVSGVFLVMLIWALSGCSPSLVAGKYELENAEIIESQVDETLVVAEADTSSIQKYEQEEALLAQILAYYEQILVAHREGDFGLAETLIDSAFVAFGQVNVDEITNQKLVSRFTSVSSSLAREYGLILMESEQISQEDPESWIPDLSDVEQFKSGQWSDEELKTIVNKISRKCDVPIDYNEKVRNSISYFQNSGRKYMTLWLQRSGRYLPMIQEIFAEEGLPLDLAYLSMIESGLNPKAVSPARAVGLWQFIYTTGKLYGLERNEWYDERRDPLKSTKAAAQHLKDLYKLYDDWNLVLAAYNSGQGRVSRAIQAGGINDYWRITLPRETSNYVPTFMAVLVISKAPELFGFENIVPEPLLEYDHIPG
ncbi:MAG: lytic transglycosylase domain-containing protein [Candidatus Latescibacterota bacterium]